MGAGHGLGGGRRPPANRLWRPARMSSVLTCFSRRAEEAAEVLAVAGAFGRAEARSMFPPNTQRFEEGAQPSSRFLLHSSSKGLRTPTSTQDHRASLYLPNVPTGRHDPFVHALFWKHTMISIFDATFPEVREMFNAARRYLKDEIGLVEFHGFVAQCRSVAKLFSSHPSILALANEWSRMINSAWNEWGIDPNPLPDADFRTWLQQQINSAEIQNDTSRGLTNTAEKTPHLRPYQAIIWHPGPDAIGIRKVYFAVDGNDAKKQLLAEHGENCTSSVWNEEDAEKPR